MIVEPEAPFEFRMEKIQKYSQLIFSSLLLLLQAYNYLLAELKEFNTPLGPN
jgi:hypothetical protein